MSTTAIPTRVAAFLVAGHIHQLWYQSQDEDHPGCCPVCCGPCWALRQMLDTGQLDALFRAYIEETGAGDSTWDEAVGRIDRVWLERAWSVDLGCREFHVAEKPVTP